MSRTKKISGGFLASGAALVACLVSARSSIPAPGQADALEIARWIGSGNDPLALFGAIIAGATAAYSIWQMFAPAPTSKSEVQSIVSRDGEVTRQDVNDLSGQLFEEGQASEQRDVVILAAIEADRIGFTPADIRDDRISEPKAIELGEAIVSYLTKARPELAEDLIVRIGGAATRAAESGDELTREVAALMAEGCFAEAGALQRRIAESRDIDAAQAHRAAANILMLTDPAAAEDEYRQSLRLEPDHVQTWLDLALLNQRRGSLEEAQTCGRRAFDCARDPVDIAKAEASLGEIMALTGDFAGAAKIYISAIERLNLITDEEDISRKIGTLLQLSAQLGQLAVQLGHLEFAESLIEQYSAFANRRYGEDHANPHRIRDAMIGLGMRADLEVRKGNLEGAKDLYIATLEVNNALRSHDRRVEMWAIDAFKIHLELGDLDKGAGNFDEAASRHRQAKALCEEMLQSKAAHIDWKFMLAISLERLGDLARDKRDEEAAAAHYRECAAVREELVERDPSNVQWVESLGTALSRLGDMSAAAGEYDAAKDYYERSLAFARQLAESDRGTEPQQRSVAVGHADLGYLAERMGELSVAVAEFEKTQEILERLAEREGSPPGCREDVATNCDSLARVAIASGDLAKARRHVDKNHELAMALAALDPANTKWLRGLTISHVRRGDLAEAEGDMETARDAYGKAEESALGLTERAPSNPIFTTDLEFVRHRLAKLASSDSRPSPSPE